MKPLRCRYRNRIVSLAPLILVLLVTAACGTTVPGAGSVPVGSAADAAQSSLDNTSTAQGATSPPTTDDPNGPSATTSSLARPLATAQTPLTAGSPGRQRLIPADAPGVTATSIRFGITYIADASQLSSIGARTPQTDAQGRSSEELMRAFGDALMTWINSHGGIGGRRLLLNYYGINLFEGSFASQEQAACSHFTEDVPVAAVFAYYSLQSLAQPACFAKHRVTLFDEGIGVSADREVFKQFAPYFYRPTMLNLSQYDHVVGAWMRSGLLRRGDTVGVLRYDFPQQRRAARLVQAELRRAQIPVKAEFVYSYPGDSGSFLTVGAQESSSAVLKFRSQGVNRVLFLDAQVAVPFLFTPAAESQHYRPRYGLTSLNGLAFQAANDSPQQLAGSVGVGWNMLGDVPEDQWVRSRTWRTCGEALKPAQLPPAYNFNCDDFFLVKAAWDRAKDISGAGFFAALSSVGDDYEPSRSTRWQIEGLDVGPATTRIAVFDDKTSAFRYQGPASAVS